jgi:hypothetical protein
VDRRRHQNPPQGPIQGAHRSTGRVAVVAGRGKQFPCHRT